MVSEELSSGDNHYWPDGQIPITPQARNYGFPMEAYVTPFVWNRYCSWTEARGTHTDKRLYELLESVWLGMDKALARNNDCVGFSFKHFYWRRNKPRSKKKGRGKLGVRLFLHPETEEPWLLIFNPVHDMANHLKKGEPDDTIKEHRENENPDGTPGPRSGTSLD